MYIFIPGLDRCGTSWIAKWLSSHPDIHCIQENYFVNGLCRTFSRRVYRSPIEDQQDLKALVDMQFSKWNSQKRHTLDKSPGDICMRVGNKPQSYLEILANYFPDAKILCFYKYGPDYAYSQLHLPNWGKRHTLAAITSRYIYNIRYVIPNNPPPNTMYIRYETLLDEPDRMAHDIVNFLGISYHRPIEVWTDPINTIHQQYNRDRWKTLCDSAQNIDLLKSMNPELLRLGYPIVE